MINFFRRIRRKLLYNKKTSRYLKYAIGEILLIMIGIFMALQLQNWNEKRKQKEQFKATLDQLYTSIKYDTEVFYRQDLIFTNQRIAIDSLLYFPDGINSNDLPYIFHYISLDNKPYTSESIYYSQQLKPDVDNKEEIELTKEIINYVSRISTNTYFKNERLEKAIRDKHIAIPKMNLEDLNGDWDYTDTTHFDRVDIKNAHDLIRSREFRAILKTSRSYKIWNMSEAENFNADGISIQNLIQKYHPGVKITYKDVGIIGTALYGYNDVGASSTPMELTDENENTWELTHYFKKGTVKFRCRDSWALNWGGSDFPNGIGYQDGPDIPVEKEGNYRVIFKPETGEYSFELLD